jgi:hypothetical protein
MGMTIMRRALILEQKNLLVLLLLFMILSIFASACGPQAESKTHALKYAGDTAVKLTLAFSTYIGGSTYDQIRDVTTDSQGNIYICGGTNSDNFPTTPGAYKRTHDRTGTQVGAFGYKDVFVSKFSPNGRLIWSTLLGGPNYDRAYGIKVDNQGYVYVAGRGGPGLPTTVGAFQQTFHGWCFTSSYGCQNAFIAKLKPDGSGLVWMSYFASGSLIRDFDIDENGDIYVTSGYWPGRSPVQPDKQWPSWFTNSYRKTPYRGQDDIIAKIKSDGTKVYWATYLGGTGDDYEAVSTRVNREDHSVYVFGFTTSRDLPYTSGAYQTINRGLQDGFVARIASDGSSLIFLTYIGGSGNDIPSTHNLAIDSSGNAYIGVWTSSSNYPTTAGAFRRTYGGGSSDIAVSKISSDGKTLIGSTFLGTNGSSNPDGVNVDADGNVYVSGNTNATNFPVTSDAYQKTNGGGQDGILFVLRADFTNLLYATYIGGNAEDMCRSSIVDSNLNFICAGTTYSDNWPTLNAVQTFRGGNHDGALAKFSLPRKDITPPAVPTK